MREKRELGSFPWVGEMCVTSCRNGFAKPLLATAPCVSAVIVGTLELTEVRSFRDPTLE